MQFVARVGTPDGRVLEETHQARDEVALRHDLQRRGLHVFTVRRRGARLSLGLPRLRRTQRVPMQAFLVFNQELAALLRAGLPLLQALELMLERLRDPTFRSVLSDIRDRVKSGVDLSDAFAAYGDAFPSLYPSTLKAGERTGELEQVVRRFIRYMRLLMEARRRVFSALVYPAVLVGLSIAMILVMTTYVVPRFTVFFQDLEAELPFLTRATMAVSGFLTGNWPWLLLGIAAGFFFYRRWGATAAGREAIDRAKVRLPVIGPVLHRFALSEFTRALSTLLAGGIPLVSSIEIAVAAVGNTWVRKTLQPTIQQVREGKPFFSSLEATGLFESLQVDMVKVGEATGSLDAMLQSVSEFLDEQVETRMQRLLSLVEPLLLVFMGGMVATLLISIYLPLFSVLGQLR